MANFNPTKHQIPEDGREADIFRRIAVLERSHRRTAPDPVPTGAIITWPSDTPPADYLICNGQSVARATFPDLFDLIGTTYGGSGSNFNLPDYRQRFLVGRDPSNSAINSLGEKRGNWDHIHLASNHTHGSGGGHSHTSAGSHSHSTSAGSAHTHGSAGSHTHSAGNSQHIHQQGSTGSAGSHSHTATNESFPHSHGAVVGGAGEQVSLVGSGEPGVDIQNHTHETSVSSGNHNHSLTSSSSSHSHSNPNMNSAGGHVHGSAGTHTHDSAGGSHTHSSAGSHSHSVGNHNHGLPSGTENTTSANPPWFALYYAIRT